jgi:hypothetical protein
MTTLASSARHRSPGRGDWKETLGRVGLVGKGVLYAVIGLLAIQLALGDAADTSQSGAIEWIGSQPFGKFLLVALTVALFALAAWRFLDAVTGDPVEGSEAKDRVKYAVQGVVYLALAVVALSATIANWNGSSTSSQSGGDSQSQQQATAVVLDWPAGRWLVAAVGLAVIGFALHQVKEHVLDQAFAERLSVGEDHWITTFGRAGYLARSIIWVMVGWFFIQAGLTYDASEAEGLSAALQTLAGEGWGRFLLWLVAVGLLAFGLFTIAEAKYRRAA